MEREAKREAREERSVVDAYCSEIPAAVLQQAEGLQGRLYEEPLIDNLRQVSGKMVDLTYELDLLRDKDSPVLRVLCSYGFGGEAGRINDPRGYVDAETKQPLPANVTCCTLLVQGEPVQVLVTTRVGAATQLHLAPTT